MENTKVYKIRINGIDESINAVDALNKQLSTLESRIKVLESSSVKVGSSGGGSKASSLSEEEKLAKQIEQIDAKRETYSKEIYQNYLAAKDVLKETVNDQKQLAAAERVQANTYSNTMDGIKQKLADLKSIHFTTDISTDEFKKQTKEIGELTEKLKELEQEYGVFNRSVGNYSEALDGASRTNTKLSVEVGVVTREFNNSREATRTLTNELNALEVSGKGNTVQAKNLRNAIYNLNSAIKDATVSSRAMDNAMDWMESFAAMGSAGRGLQTYFGFSNDEITKNIQDLVALQGVLQGVEKIRKQMETREGIGQILGKGFDKIDTWSYGLKRLSVQIFGVGTASKVAAVGVKALNFALKSLMSLGIALAIDAILGLMTKAIASVKDWAKGNADLVDSEKLLKAQLDVINTTLEERKRLNDQMYKAGYLSKVEKEIEDEKALAQALADVNKEIARRAGLDDKNTTFNKAYTSGETYQAEFFQGYENVKGGDFEIKTYDDLIARWEKLSDAISEGNKKLSEAGSDTNALRNQMDGLKNELNNLEQFVGGNMINALTKFDISTVKGKRALADFVQGVLNGSDQMQKSVLLRLPEIVSNNEGKLGDALNRYLELIKQFAGQANSAVQQFKFDEYVESILDSADETGKRQYEKQKKELKQRYDNLNEQQKEAEAKRYEEANKALDNMFKKRQQKVTSQNIKDKNRIEKEENERYQFQISLMEEGLRKQLVQLEEERREKLKKAKEYGVDLEKVNTYYDNRVLEAKKDFANEMKKISDDMYNALLDNDISYLQKKAELQERDAKITRQGQENLASEKFATNKVGSYGIQAKESYRKSTQAVIAPTETIENKQLVEDTKKLIEIETEYNIVYEKSRAARRKAEKEEEEYVNKKTILTKLLNDLESQKSQITEKQYLNDKAVTEKQIKDLENKHAISSKIINDEVSILEQVVDEKSKLYRQQSILINKSYDENEAKMVEDQLRMEGYSKSMSATFENRITNVENYWTERIKVEEGLAEKNAEIQKEIINKQTKQAIEAEDQAYFEQQRQQSEYYKKKQQAIQDDYNMEIDSLTKQLNNKQITQDEYNEKSKEAEQLAQDEQLGLDKEYNKLGEELYQTHQNTLQVIEEDGSKKLIEIDQEVNEKKKNLNQQYYNDTLSEFAAFQNALSQLESKQPIMNAFGFTNWKQTDKNNKELLASYEKLAREINQKKIKLNKDFENGLIDKTVYMTSMSDLDAFAANLGDKIDGVKDKLSLGNHIQTIIQESQQYLQGASDLFMNIMQAVWAAEDAEFDREQEQLEKEADFLQEQLQKQEDIIRDHVDAINDIEGELSTARGDRRNELIARLNEEVKAEKKAQKEKQKIEAQQKKNEEKQDELEKKRQEAEYNRSILQAIVNGAMAVTMAGMNTWPFPAIAMMSLAAGSMAAQLAIIKANKPYAKGGLLTGPSHAEGGMPILGSDIVVEGSEYVVNKRTTSQNLDVLEYINAKHKKLSLGDFIDFYDKQSNVKRVIQSASPRTHFADGGQIPYINYNVDSSMDRLITAFEAYSNRPQYVAVTEIEDKMADVNYIRTLAGVGED